MIKQFHVNLPAMGFIIFMSLVHEVNCTESVPIDTCGYSIFTLIKELRLYVTDVQ